MSRNKKCRRICLTVTCRRFQASPDAGEMTLALDELEAIRLADYEEMEQNIAAEKMGISRGTFQRLLYAGHRKIAEALLKGQTIHIAEDHGDREGCENGPMCKHCYILRPQKVSIKYQGEKMKIAVTCHQEEVFQHFGQTPEFAIFEIEDGRIVGMQTVSTAGSGGHGALAGFLAERKVELLLCGGIGGGAQQALAQAGIKVIGGITGGVIPAVGDYLKGELRNNPSFGCQHHNHEHSHHQHGEGGDHHCGNCCH